MKTVLELGVGTGPNLAYYGGRTSITNVIGVDPNEKMARYAKEAAVAAGFSPEQFKFVHAVTFTTLNLHLKFSILAQGRDSIIQCFPSCMKRLFICLGNFFV